MLGEDWGAGNGKRRGVNEELIVLAGWSELHSFTSAPYLFTSPNSTERAPPAPALFPRGQKKKRGGEEERRRAMTKTPAQPVLERRSEGGNGA